MQLGVIVGMKIDKPWGDNEPAGIDHFGGVVAVQPADFGDFPILNANIGFVARYTPLIMVSNCGIALPPL
jgi:hypothetical protein